MNSWVTFCWTPPQPMASSWPFYGTRGGSRECLRPPRPKRRPKCACRAPGADSELVVPRPTAQSNSSATSTLDEALSEWEPETQYGKSTFLWLIKRGAKSKEFGGLKVACEEVRSGNLVGRSGFKAIRVVLLKAMVD